MVISEFQIGLIGLGATAVIGVWIYNKLQERKYRKLAERIFRGEHSDVLLQGEGAAGKEDQRDQYDLQERIEPGEATNIPGGTANTELESELPAELADPVVDCMVMLQMAAPVVAPVLWQTQRQQLEAVEEHLRWLGFDAAKNQWRKLTAHDAASYQRLVAVLQLADRSGHVSEAELDQFFNGLRQLAASMNAEMNMPPLADIFDHARALDEFCASVDWRIDVNVVNRDSVPFSGTKLRGLAEAAGMRLRDDGLFHAEDDEGQSVFTLSNLGGLPFAPDEFRTLTTVGLTLTLDVPLVAQGQAAFARLLAVAQHLTGVLDGVVVDEQRAPLSEPVLDAISAKIGEFQRRMAENQIPAGSLRAQRLYS